MPAAVVLASLLVAIPAADELLLRVSPPTGQTLVAAVVDLSSAAGLAAVDLKGGLTATLDGQPLPFQYIPADGGGAGVVLARLPASRPALLRLRAAGQPPRPQNAFDGVVRTPVMTARHDVAAGGFPTAFEFGGAKLAGFSFNDRLYEPKRGLFTARAEAGAVELVSAGPLAVVVRQRSRFVAPGTPDASPPTAVYDWYYFLDRPIVGVRAEFVQSKPLAWKEAHFLEMRFPAGLARWRGAAAPAEGTFSRSRKVTRFDNWAAVFNDAAAVGVFAAGSVLVYDDGPSSYLHAHGDEAWQGWDGSGKRASAWLAFARDPAGVAQAAAAGPPGGAATASVESLHQRLAQLEAAGVDHPDRWRLAIARGLEAEGRLADALAAADGRLPAGVAVLKAGRLVLAVRKQGSGVALGGLSDVKRGASLAATAPLPLFQLIVRNAQTKAEATLKADEGWDAVDVTSERTAAGESLAITWKKPRWEGLQATVRAVAAADAAHNRLAWRLTVEDLAAPWGVWRTTFPQVALAGQADARVFVPLAAGVVKRLDGPARLFTGTYPAGWTSMPYMACYEATGEGGLYVGLHDPWAGTKDLAARRIEGGVAFSFDVPAEDMGKPGVGYTLPGQAVWQLFEGDWFDAAAIYRAWVRGAAKWWPPLGPDGRDDTPRWMRELPAWVLSGGAAKECVERVKEFARALDLPVGFHWYSWHQIPFDNDYPHYYPTKPGFEAGVKELQSAGVYVMPYINGRLWDTRDRGTEDAQFTRVARTAASKNEEGQPYVESYSSKEADGSKVSLAAMCPTTPLWRETMKRTVLRITGESGTMAVYLDQIAAARPTLCFDAAHGHPLGGGHWWTAGGYWPMLDEIRAALPAGRMLTSECNADAYVRWFDGYLTWHWQEDGQVPAFPAVYGGAIQMFGRAYGGGPTADLALRMKAAQQLAFGEQLGWLNPGLVRQQENFAFFRDVAHLRWRLRRYFYAGEMLRPPVAAGVPTVQADWQWHGVRMVTTPAVLAGAWRLPAEGRTMLVFTNVSDAPLRATLRYALPPGARLRRTVTAAGEGQWAPAAGVDGEVTFAPRATFAWEFSEKPPASAAK